MDSYFLEDIEEACRQSPETFFIPRREERRALEPGRLVRLHFVLRHPGPDDPRAERMWVEVESRSGDADSVEYQGVLTNQPAFIDGLARGDTIGFGPEHIARVLISPDDPSYLVIGEEFAMVSEVVLRPGRRACFAYREPSDRDEDSGWRLLAGDESDDFLEDPHNIRVVNVYWLVDRDPSLVPIFRASENQAFERADGESSWREVADWEPPQD